MASIHQQISIDAAPHEVWSALADVGALHTRIARGFVIDCRMDGEARIVTFANGLVARERIISVDDTRRRVTWSAESGHLTHHNASTQVFEESGAEGKSRSRVVWIADLLPHELAPVIAGMIEHGLAAMKATLEADHASANA